MGVAELYCAAVYVKGFRRISRSEAEQLINYRKTHIILYALTEVYHQIQEKSPFLSALH